MKGCCGASTKPFSACPFGLSQILGSKGMSIVVIRGQSSAGKSVKWTESSTRRCEFVSLPIGRPYVLSSWTAASHAPMHTASSSYELTGNIVWLDSWQKSSEESATAANSLLLSLLGSGALAKRQRPTTSACPTWALSGAFGARHLNHTRARHIRWSNPWKAYFRSWRKAREAWHD